MNAELVSLNVGRPKAIDSPKGPVLTSIFKIPTARRLAVSSQRIEDDEQADLLNHGGENKAVYAYPLEHYRSWSDELSRDDFVHGQFGENLTIRGLLEDELGIGDLLRIGTAVLQVSQPRKPCFKLGIRMDDPRFVRRFLQSGRSGFYLRVAEPGELGAGDAIERIEAGPSGMTVHEVWRLSYGEGGPKERMELALGLKTLDEEWTRAITARLDGLRAGAGRNEPGT